ncbi:MAG: phosphate butyryltransferase [Deltaproteobacteria bacterium HGW-Deltaproteobacteria-11]|nr:MAG: phosphate butyryltransferase [Deltaproteobacteria bacterium HGW-Deltaproteobacteria-11]
MISTFKEILTRAKAAGERKRAAIAAPVLRQLKMLEVAAQAGLIMPVLVGDSKKLEDLWKGASLAASDCHIVHEPDPSRALARAIALVKNREADILLQGGTEHQTFIDRVTDADAGLMNGRLMSHVSVFELPERNKIILVTDTYIQDQPTLVEKQSILEHALRLAALLEIRRPKVAVLAAIEQVNPGIPSTLDAAILSKMADRRQFGDIVLEGPLDIDCALDQKAAARKGVHSEVTRNVDIYLAPEMDTGYSLAQLLVYIGKMQMAGVLMGTGSPVVLDLPFVSPDNKIVEIALATMMAGQGAHHG